MLLSWGREGRDESINVRIRFSNEGGKQDRAEDVCGLHGSMEVEKGDVDGLRRCDADLCGE